MVQIYVGIGSIKSAAVRVKALNCDGNELCAVQFYGDVHL